MDKANLFTEDNDFNICKSWLCDSTDGQTYSLSDWFGKKLVPCPKEFFWEELEGCFCTQEWEDSIGYEHEYKIDDPKVDDEAQAMADRINAYIDKLNRQIENLKKEKRVFSKKPNKKERSNMGKRSDSEILKDLVSEVRKYNALRDDEWDFEDSNGSRDMWSDEASAEHDKLLAEIQSSRQKVGGLIAEATGEESVNF